MTVIELRDGSETQDRRLDRLKEFDEASKSHPVRTGTIAQAAPRNHTWTLFTTLDQGVEGACVGASWAHELLAWPARAQGVDMRFARERIYWPAQRDDEWEGGEYPGAVPIMSGTSVLAGVKVLHAMGAYKGYKWAFTEQDLILGLGYAGPAVLGTYWWEGMWEPDANGYIWPTGNIVGGHAILIRGVNVTQGYYLLHNSWGPGWGIGGTCKVSFEAMRTLRANAGEVCFPTGRSTVVVRQAA